MTQESIAEKPVRLLIVDDEAPLMNALCDTLGGEGYLTAGFTSACAALAALRCGEFDLVLTDLMMPEMDGIALLKNAFEIDSSLVGIVMTGHATVPTAIEALKTGALDYIFKPFKLSVVLPVLARALSVRRLRLENIQLREAVEIHQLSKAIASGLEFDRIVHTLADAALHQTQARDLSLLLPAQDGNELCVAAIRGNPGLKEGSRVALDAELLDWVEKSRVLLCQPEVDSSAVSAPLKAPVAADLSIPLLAGGKLAGILNLTWAKPRRPTSAGQMKALGILVGAAASALEASSLLDRLRKAEQRYRRLAENAPDIIFRFELDQPRGISFVNPRVLPITGYSPADYYADPDLIFKVIHPDDRRLFESVLGADAPPSAMSAVRWLNRNGAVFWMEQHHTVVYDADGRRIAIECIARDVSERRNLEDQVRQSQKMEAIGRMAAGVAHDFNNLLMVIGGYSAHALSVLPETDALYAEIREIRKAGDHAASLTRQLLAFSRREMLRPHVFDLNSTVADMDRMLRRIVAGDVELVTVLAPELWFIRADRGQIEQVMMNLVVNARDAMPKGGKLVIETANVVGNDTTAGPGVMLAVSDTGQGMDEATQARIFEPFFTTKPRGEGTGLGLSMVYSIVKQSGGTIQVQSEPGKGTAFRIFFPAVLDGTEAGEYGL